MRIIEKIIRNKNGGVERGGWCEKEFEEEAGEEPDKVGGTRRKVERIEGSWRRMRVLSLWKVEACR